MPDALRAAFLDARHIDLAVALTVGDLAALIKLAIDHVKMRVHHKWALAQSRNGQQYSRKQSADRRIVAGPNSKVSQESKGKSRKVFRFAKCALFAACGRDRKSVV